MKVVVADGLSAIVRSEVVSSRLLQYVPVLVVLVLIKGDRMVW